MLRSAVRPRTNAAEQLTTHSNRGAAMATVDTVTRADPAQSAPRAALARLRAAEAHQLARIAFGAGHHLAGHGYLCEAQTWRAMARSLSQGGLPS